MQYQRFLMVMVLLSFSFQGMGLGSARAVQVSYRHADNHMKPVFSGRVFLGYGASLVHLQGGGAPLKTVCLTYSESHLQKLFFAFRGKLLVVFEYPREKTEDITVQQCFVSIVMLVIREFQHVTPAATLRTKPCKKRIHNLLLMLQLRSIGLKISSGLV